MGRKHARPKARKYLNRTKSKIDETKIEVLDEWEIVDIDRDEQMAGLARREKRWKEIALAKREAEKLEKKAIDNVEKMKRGTKGRPMTALEEAWLRCDFLLSHIMEEKAYMFMEWQLENDPECYKFLYKKFISPNMMHNAQAYVDYFAKGGEPYKMITHGDIIKMYKKYKNIKSKITFKRKGEVKREL